MKNKELDKRELIHDLKFYQDILKTADTPHVRDHCRFEIKRIKKELKNYV